MLNRPAARQALAAASPQPSAAATRPWAAAWSRKAAMAAGQWTGGPSGSPAAPPRVAGGQGDRPPRPVGDQGPAGPDGGPVVAEGEVAQRVVRCGHDRGQAR